MPNRGFAPIIILIIVAIAVAVGGGTFYYTHKIKSEPVMCTMEAKQCPDGSYVGRTGPKCEFATCPSTGSGQVSVGTETWKTYTNTQYGFEFKYPNTFSVEDSSNIGIPKTEVLLYLKEKDSVDFLVMKDSGANNLINAFAIFFKNKNTNTVYG